MPNLSRRTALAAGMALALPGIVRAQDTPGPKLGSLTPLTGAGGSYGPAMRDGVAAVVREANRAGGILGREATLVSEDDQTNSDAGVRAARKLIDVDRVAAIVGTWASSVTTAVAPLCWESKTFLTTVSGADAITLLPHQGYILRTQPNSDLQGRGFTALIKQLGGQKVAWIGPQAPYAEPTVRSINRELGAGTVTATLYDPTKSSFRSEVEQGLRARPDVVLAGGFTPDTAVLLRDLYRVGYKGTVLAFGFAVTDAFAAGQPREATQGVYALSPSPSQDSPAYRHAAELLGRPELDTYVAQVFDQATLVLLAMALGGGVTGTTVRDAIRRAADPAGEPVSDVAMGLKAISAGARSLRYDGASGPCRFNDVGDITEARFRIDQVRDGKLVRTGTI